MNRCVSYSFFRHDASHYEHPNCGEARGKVFLNYVRLILRAHQAIWRGYDLLFHHDNRVTEFPYFQVMRKAEEYGLVYLVPMGEAKTLCGSMLWRMKPIWGEGYDIVVCRDVDSIPLPRDRRAVEEFAESSKSIHAIHDSSAHSGIMGGTSSFRSERFKRETCTPTWSMFEQRQAADRSPDGWNKHGKDQNFLNRWLWVSYHREVFLHELNHDTDMAGHCDTRRSISSKVPEDVLPAVAECGDSFSKVLGGCDDVEKPYAFYDSLDIPEIRKIREIEREVLG